MVVEGVLKATEIWTSTLSLDDSLEINIDKDLTGTDFFEITKGSGDDKVRLFTVFSGTGNVGIGTANAASEKLEVVGNVKAQKFISTVPSGIPPFELTSTTLVSNLNADLLDGYHASITASVNTVVVRDAQGKIKVSGVEGTNSSDLLISGKNYGVEIKIDEGLSGNNRFIVSKGAGGLANALLYVNSNAPETVVVNGVLKTNEIWGSNANPLKISSLDYGVEINIDSDSNGTDYFQVTKGSGDNLTKLFTIYSNTGNVGIGTTSAASEKLEVVGNIKAQKFISTVSSPIPPFEISSNALISNLNADLLDGYHASNGPDANTVVVRDGQGFATVFGLRGSNFDNLLISGRGWGVEVRIDESLAGDDFFKVTKGFGSTTLFNVHSGTGNVGIGIPSIASEKLEVSGNVKAKKFISTVTSESPLQVSSSVLVTNLNSDLLDGYHASTNPETNTVVVRDSQGNIKVSGITGSNTGALIIDGKNHGVEIHSGTNTLLSVASNGNTNINGNLTVSGTINGNLNGNASTANKLQTPRIISLSGALSGSTSFDGSTNVSINASINAGSVGTTQLATGAVTSEKIANDAVTSEKIAPGSVGTDQIADSSITYSKLAPSVISSLLRIFKTTIGDEINTSYTITHNFGTRDVLVSVFSNSGDYDDVEVEIKRPTLNTVEIKLLTPPGNNALRVVIIG
jgi:hypothetical protein